MADISSYTHKWRAAPAGFHQSDGNKINKRNRQPVSCAPCRTRKLKCDRGHPCDACTKRSDEESCVYGKISAPPAQRRDESKPNMKTQDRLRHLEDLVRQMIGPDKAAETPRTPPVDDVQQPEGSLNRDLNGLTSSYTGSTHWTTVLDQIHELRNTLSPTDPSEDHNLFDDEDDRTYSLFAAPQPPPLNIVLQRHLPSREDCNRYLSTYFNSKYITVPFIHTYQFKRQYERFWDSQLETSPIWIATLFSLLCIADNIRRAPLSLYRNHADEKPYSPFLTASAQCMIIGNFAKAQPFILEALAMHCQCKYAVTLDPSQELGMIASLAFRLAYTMGYHREPTVFENQFTVFESEMRRRVWHLLRQFDLMVSFQIGLPPLMQPESFDTRLPSHHLDEDFDEDSVVMPKPRPDTEATQMLYLLTKARLMNTFSKVAQHTLTFPSRPFTENDINQLDHAIVQTIDSVPAVLRVRSMSLSYADPPTLTMTRSNLMFLGEKARTVLHRKYMVSGPNADHSRQVCITCSTRMIQHFLDLNAELQPGGQLYNDRWMLTSFNVNDFLLALMVLCLTFSLGRKKYLAQGGDAERWLELDQEAAKIHAVLESAVPLCREYGERAREARHVAQAVSVVLSKLRPKPLAVSTSATNQNPSKGPVEHMFGLIGMKFSVDGAIPLANDDKLPDMMPLSIHENGPGMVWAGNGVEFPPQQVEIIPGSSFDPSASTGGVPTFSNPTEPSPSSSWEMLDGPLHNMLDGPEQIDWVQFDQFLWTYGGQNGSEEEIL